MIEKIISKLAEIYLDYENIDELHDKYIDLKEGKGKIEALEAEYKVTKKEIEKKNFLAKLFKSRKQKIRLQQIKVEIESIKETLKNTFLTDEEKSLVQKYINVLALEDAVSNDTLNEHLDEFVIVFDGDFSNVIKFCEKYRIKIELTDKDVEFLELLRTNHPELEKDIRDLLKDNKPVVKNKKQLDELNETINKELDTIELDNKTIDYVINSMVGKAKSVSKGMVLLPNDVTDSRTIYSDLLKDSNHKLGQFIDKLLEMKSLDPEEIFNIIIEDKNINNKNTETLTRLKEIIINMITNFNLLYQKKYQEDYNRRENVNMFQSEESIRKTIFKNSNTSTLYSDMILKLIVIKKICQKEELLELPIDKDNVYELPIEYYDFEEFLVNGKKLNSLNSEKGFNDDALNYVFSNYSLIKIPVKNTNKELRNILHAIEMLKNDDDKIIDFLVSFLNSNNFEYTEDDIATLVNLIKKYKESSEHQEKITHIAFMLIYIQNNLKVRKKKDPIQEL